MSLLVPGQAVRLAIELEHQMSVLRGVISGVVAYGMDLAKNMAVTSW